MRDRASSWLTPDREDVVGKRPYSVVLGDVSLIDVEDFKAGVPASDLHVIRPKGNDDSHNELATILILTLSVPALTALTMWLLRTRASEIIDYTVTIRKPDGTEMTVHLKIKRTSSEAPNSQAIKQIAEALKLPEDAILVASTI